MVWQERELLSAPLHPTCWSSMSEMAVQGTDKDAECSGVYKKGAGPSSWLLAGCCLCPMLTCVSVDEASNESRDVKRASSFSAGRWRRGMPGELLEVSVPGISVYAWERML